MHSKVDETFLIITRTCHCQEDPEFSIHGHNVTISEDELGFVHFLALQNNGDLLRCYGQHWELDSVEFIKTTPRSRLRQSYATALIKQVQLRYKPNLHYTRGITPKRVTSGKIHLRGLAPGHHSSEETSLRWRVVRDTVYDVTGPGIEPPDLPHR